MVSNATRAIRAPRQRAQPASEKSFHETISITVGTVAEGSQPLA
jgi:hypothetical protein